MAERAEALVSRGWRWLTGRGWPRVACEVCLERVAAARRARASQKIEAWAERPLGEGIVRPGPQVDNVLDSEALLRNLREVLQEVAPGEKRIGVILPDPVARIWLLAVEAWPERPTEAVALLRWRLTKEVAFDLEQAVLAYQPFSPADKGKAVLVAAAQRNLIRQYEACFEAAGYQPGWVTLATLATLGCIETDAGVTQLLVRRDSSGLGLAIVRGDKLAFVRSVPAMQVDGSAQALFEQIYPSLVYFQDQWGEAVSRALLVGVGEASSELARLLAREAGCEATGVGLGGLPERGSVEQEQNLAALLGFFRAGAQT